MGLIDRLSGTSGEGLGGGDNEYVTVTEIMAKTGHGRGYIMRRLHELKAQGELDITTVKRSDITGRVCYKPGYKIREVDDAD